MAGKLAAWGYRRAICTSHSSFLYWNCPATVTAACEKLSAVLAHPERYLYLQRGDYQAFKDAGVQFQRNLGTLEGMYGEAVRKRAETLNAEGMYDWTGSDLHDKAYSDFLDEHIWRQFRFARCPRKP